MKKVIITCDCCGEEMQQDQVFTLEHYIHVSPDFNRMQGHAKVVNGRMHSISGRTDKKDFCLPCYNRLFDVFFEEIKTIQDKIVNA